MKRVYIWLSTNNSNGCDNLVEPMDILKDKYENQVDREILDCLYSATKLLSASEITDIIKSNSPDRDVIHPARNIRYRLKMLVEKMVIDMAVRDATGDRGRAPEVYALSKSLQKEIDDYLNIKKTSSMDTAKCPVPGLVVGPDGNKRPLLAKVIYIDKFEETKGKKMRVSTGWAIPSSNGPIPSPDQKPWLLMAMLTAQQLGHLSPSDPRIEQLKKDLMISMSPIDSK